MISHSVIVQELTLRCRLIIAEIPWRSPRVISQGLFMIFTTKMYLKMNSITILSQWPLDYFAVWVWTHRLGWLHNYFQDNWLSKAYSISTGFLTNSECIHFADKRACVFNKITCKLIVRQRMKPYTDNDMILETIPLQLQSCRISKDSSTANST